MLIMFYMLIPPPSTLRSLMFKGANVTKFFKCYKDFYLNYYVTDEDRLIRLLCYYIQLIIKTIKSLKE